jgi:glutamate-1-semialdehyde 2,1-aminomutase
VWSLSGEPASLQAVPEGPGIPSFVSDYTVVLPWNDPAAFERIRQEGDQLAAVIIELVQGAGGALPVDRDHLEELQAVCRECGVLLIADEVLTGFRVGLSGASGFYGVTPDLVALGKVVAGGLPGSAVTGRAELIAQQIDPLRDQTVLMAGTNSGHPMSMAAGRATLDVLIRDQDELYPRLFTLGEKLRAGLQRAFDGLGFGRVTGEGPLWGVHPTFQEPGPEGAKAAADAATALSGLLLREGVFVSSPAHLGFLGAAHTEDDVDRIVEAHETALHELRERGFC